MKTLIEFSEGVAVASPAPSSPALMANTTHTKQTTVSDSIDCDRGNDSDTDDTIASSTSIESSSDDAKTTNESTSCSNTSVSTIETGNQMHPAKKRSVSFGPIHVRQHERIVGDHPETRVGVPLGIGWAYNDDDVVSIDRYESDRDRIRRGRGSFRLTSITRKNMLLNVYGIPKEEILQAEADTDRLRWRRQQAARNKSAATKTETACKKMGKRIRKVGVSFLKGMSYAAQIGVPGGGGGLPSASKPFC